MDRVSSPMDQYGSTLATVIWVLSSIMIICVVARLVYSLRRRISHPISARDDVMVALVALVGLASMLTTLTNVSATATTGGESRIMQKRDSQSISYASTILFIFTLGLSKISLLAWLGQLQLSRTYNLCRIITGCCIVFYILASTTGVILQCQPPGSWTIGKSQCLSPYLLWTAIIAIDIALDMTLIFLPVFITTTLDIQTRKEVRATTIFTFRATLIIPSLTRLVYLQQPPLPTSTIPPQDNPPYVITTQVHLTLAVLISCTTALPHLTNLIAQTNPNPTPLRKHWSTSTLGSDIADDYFASAPVPTLAAEPMHISYQGTQALMATPSCSRGDTMGSVQGRGGGRVRGNGPVRPAPPEEHQRPDMSLFVRRAVVRPPRVMVLREGRQGAVKKVQFDV